MASANTFQRLKLCTIKQKAYRLMEFVWRPKTFSINFCKHQFEFKLVTEQEILKDLQRLKRTRYIPATFLKNTNFVIAKPLTRSLKTGIVPIDFKLAKVVPIFKSGNQENFDNYRPVSVLLACRQTLQFFETTL